MNFKKVFASLVAGAMVFSSMSMGAFAAEINTNLTEATVFNEDMTVSTDIVISETIQVSGNVTVSGGGSITRADGMTGPMFSVDAGSTLTLEDVTIDGGAVWTYEISENEPTAIEEVLGRGSVNSGIVSGVAVIENRGIVVVAEGAVLKNNDTNVINSASGAVVEITGGTICDNNGSAVMAQNANNVLNVTDGKVYGNNAAGGGLTYIKGTSTVDGGEFYNNYAGIGGVFRLVSGANITVNGGKFYNNESVSGGVAYVYAWSGSSVFTINGGEFYDNHATEGGVVYSQGKCSITLNDGNIHHNSAYTGGAFRLYDYAYFTMNGGIIADNTAETLGGALRQWGSWGTSFNGGIVRDNIAEEGEAIWLGNGLFIGETEFVNNDIYASDFIRLTSEDFNEFELSAGTPSSVYVVPNNNSFEVTPEHYGRISINSWDKKVYYDETAKKFVISEKEHGAESVSVEFEDVTESGAEGEKVYNIVLKANDGDEIHELSSADLQFVLTSTPANTDTSAPKFKVAAKEFVTLTEKAGEENRYMFNYNGVDEYQESGAAIVIGQIKVTGYGGFSISVADNDTNAVHATSLSDNLVESFVAGGAEDNDDSTGVLKTNEDTNTSDDYFGTISDEVKIPECELTINVEFPNSIEENMAEYQDMTVTIAGSNDTETINLADFTSADGKGYTIVRDLDKYFKYTVTVEGAGYRTVSYTVTMNEDKTLNFWNNVKDKAEPVEEKKTAGFVNTTFLAGDIVKDANINIYDLSAVVAYFGTTNDRTAESALTKYDLNRDGEIDSKDVAYVLVSWDK